jgi:hypothetical protein
VLCGCATARRSRSLAQHQRLPAATQSRRADESLRRPVPHNRQPLQPQEPTYPGMAGEASASAAGLHSGRGVLAQPPRSVVAPVQTRGFSRKELRRRGGDRVGYEGRHNTAQPAGETVGLGSATEAPAASAAFLCIPSLRNGACKDFGIHYVSFDRGSFTPLRGRCIESHKPGAIVLHPG